VPGNDSEKICFKFMFKCRQCQVKLRYVFILLMMVNRGHLFVNSACNEISNLEVF